MDYPKFTKVIVWGYPLGGHTHSNVHYAFYRAFKQLGYDAYHVDDLPENTDKFKDINNCLYLTSSGADNNIPLNKTCTYITHNCGPLKYLSYKNIKLQVLIDESMNLPGIQKVNHCSYYQPDLKTIHMYWATNLLPDEFDFNAIDTSPKDKIYWVGTIEKHGIFENYKNLGQFQTACIDNGKKFIHAWQEFGGQVSPEKNIELIRTSYLAPAITGTWQTEVGFVPCRVFKNVSYGALPVTNSSAAKQLFGDLMVFNKNSYDLYKDADGQRTNKDLIISAMNYVKDNHTYISRINDIFEVL